MALEAQVAQVAQVAQLFEAAQRGHADAVRNALVEASGVAVAAD